MALHVRYNTASPKKWSKRDNKQPGNHMKKTLTSLLITTIFISSGVTSVMLTGCERKPKTLGEKIDDALDARPHEKLKDAGENLSEAARDEVKK
jgi:hypothetical protein